jgi:transcriptional regulator with XRE-family HTH domain
VLISYKCAPNTPEAPSRPIPNEIDVQVGIQIRARREQLGMSRDDLALELGISRRTLQAYETGKVRPMPARLREISEALEVPISYLFDKVEDSLGETQPLTPGPRRHAPKDGI